MAAVSVKRSSKFSTSFLNSTAKFKMLHSFRQKPLEFTSLENVFTLVVISSTNSLCEIAASYFKLDVIYFQPNFRIFVTLQSISGLGDGDRLIFSPGPFGLFVHHASWQATLDFYFMPKCKHPHEASENRTEREITKE